MAGDVRRTKRAQSPISAATLTYVFDVATGDVAELGWRPRPVVDDDTLVVRTGPRCERPGAIQPRPAALMPPGGGVRGSALLGGAGELHGVRAAGGRTAVEVNTISPSCASTMIV